MTEEILCKCTDCEKVFYSNLIKGNNCPLILCYGKLEEINGEEFLEDC